MAEVDIKSFDPQEFRLFQQMGSCSQHFNEDFIFSEESMNVETPQILDKGLMEYGCLHYRRRCRIRAPCCNEVFDCRHCHNEAKNNINVDQKHRHDMPRHEVKQVICSLCGTEQEVQQVCINCGVCMGKYFCETCKLFDDDTSKKQYHCDGCGICRIGGPENFFHCYKCGCCYSNLLKNSHPCVEGAMHHDCPVCFEFLFESRYDVTVLPCGHTIHESCLKEMRDHYQYACPLCSKSVCDMSKVWEKFDMEIAATPMPEPYLNKMVWILCNDCGKSSEVQFHVVAQKCMNCKSYNTRQTRSWAVAARTTQLEKQTTVMMKTSMLKAIKLHLDPCICIYIHGCGRIWDPVEGLCFRFSFPVRFPDPFCLPFILPQLNDVLKKPPVKVVVMRIKCPLPCILLADVYRENESVVVMSVSEGAVDHHGSVQQADSR